MNLTNALNNYYNKDVIDNNYFKKSDLPNYNTFETITGDSSIFFPYAKTYLVSNNTQVLTLFPTDVDGIRFGIRTDLNLFNGNNKIQSYNNQPMIKVNVNYVSFISLSKHAYFEFITYNKTFILLFEK